MVLHTQESFLVLTPQVNHFCFDACQGVVGCRILFDDCNNFFRSSFTQFIQLSFNFSRNDCFVFFLSLGSVPCRCVEHFILQCFIC
ncbi:hypothetical protein CJ20_210 [Escherichia phage CJ20]|nr:hypothetical protein CJ20_210 [Escherichia phage CJ20]